MRRNIFNSKKLYIANVIISLILFIISSLSLYSLIFFEKNTLKNENQSIELVLYSGYIITYLITVIFLSIMYFLAIVLNFFDFSIHYSKHEKDEARYLLIAIIVIFSMIFSSLIYLNNKRKFSFDTSEVDKIGTQND
ncbi:hypothetical protein [Flavobacterium sp. B17]|uniref:hypothetical protein n=1 Tax=Flavobacterium sp. B17 TaxID=95618 RepID=UPI0011D26811|nr:hypothetical protein [Flavobacterium sp. B17]